MHWRQVPDRVMSWVFNEAYGGGRNGQSGLRRIGVMHVGMSVMVGDRPTDSHSLWAYITFTTPVILSLSVAFTLNFTVPMGVSVYLDFSLWVWVWLWLCFWLWLWLWGLSLNLTLTWTLTLTVTLIFCFPLNCGFFVLYYLVFKVQMIMSRAGERF